MNRNLSESYCYSVAGGKRLEFMTDFIAKKIQKRKMKLIPTL